MSDSLLADIEAFLTLIAWRRRALAKPALG
jgi:hypothetical protein